MNTKQTPLLLIIAVLALSGCGTIQVGIAAQNEPGATIVATAADLASEDSRQREQGTPFKTTPDPTLTPDSNTAPVATDTIGGDLPPPEPTYTPIPPSATIPLESIIPTSTPTNTTEAIVLATILETIDQRGPTRAYIQVDKSRPSAVSYRVIQPLMAGADEYAGIIRYPTATEAKAAFGQPEYLFHDLPARRDRATNFVSGHYQDRHWITWISGQRVYRAQTSYNSTFNGNARDPVPIAEALYQAAVEHGLIP